MIRRAAIFAFCLLAACSPSGEPRIDVSSAWARPTLQAGQTSAAYLTINNDGNASDQLVDASSPAAARVSLHSSSNEGGIARMRPVENGLVVEAGSAVKLEPGGYHLMLEQLNRPLTAGEAIPVRLRFEHSGEREVEARIASAAGASHQGH